MKIEVHIGAMVRHGDTENRYQRLRELGYDSVDEDLCRIKDPWYQDVEEMKRTCASRREAAEKNGITISQVHGPWPTDDTVPENRRAVWDLFHRSLYGAYLMGSPILVVHPQMPFGWGGPEDPDEAERVTVGLLEDLMPDAEKYGVTVCLENMPFKKQRISTMPYIRRAVESVKSEKIGICFDTGHSNVFGRDPLEDIRIAGSYLKTLHVHDNDGERDLHLTPFLGTVPWARFIQGIAESGFQGPLSLETGGPAEKLAPEAPLTVVDAAERMNADAARYLAAEIEKAR